MVNTGTADVLLIIAAVLFGVAAVVQALRAADPPPILIAAGLGIVAVALVVLTP